MAVSGVAAAATVAAVAVLPTPAGAATAGDGYWHTSDAQVLDAAGNPVRSFGYNTIRIPFSDQLVEVSKVPDQISFFGRNGPINTDLPKLTSMQILDKKINYAGSPGLKVILDNHRSEDGNSAEQNGLW